MDQLFSNLKFYLYFFKGTTREELEKTISNNGGKLISNFKEGCLVTHIITTEQKLLESSYQIKQAEKMRVPVLTSQWLTESVIAKKLLPFGLFVCLVPKLNFPTLRKPTITFS